VVVNDLGGTRDGGGQSSKVADTVVAEIRAKSMFSYLIIKEYIENNVLFNF
jgi:predicted alpha/beta-hydrolase family hydrolase